jgi:hypothetical protein
MTQSLVYLVKNVAMYALKEIKDDWNDHKLRM